MAKKPSRGDLAIAFIEKLSITIGEDAGKPFKLRPWQKKFVKDVLDPIRKDGKRMVRRAVLSLGRKNGKSELAAALVLVFLIGPEAELNGEIIAAANSRDQAKVVFNAVKRLVEAEPELLKYLEIVPSTSRIYVKRQGITAEGSVFRAVSAEAGNLHGLNPSMVIVDELAQAKTRELFDVLVTSQGARSEPLLMVISTQSHDPTHVLSELIQDGLKGNDPTTVCHLYSAPEGCDVLDESAWMAANPALGDFLDIEAFRIDAARAKRLPSDEQSFRLLRLNQQVSPNASLITRADWKACQSEFEFADGEEIFLGLDMADAGLDLAALVAVSALDGSRVKAWFWKAEGNLDQHSTRDGVRYDLYAHQGLLETTPGRSINPEFVAAKIVEIYQRYTVKGLAFDRFRMDNIFRYFDALGFDVQEGHGYGLRLEKWGQGFVDMAPAIDAFERAVIEADLKHDGHPLLTWTVMNAQSLSDAAGNRKLDKRASRFRIDGAVALAMALGLKARDRTAVTARSPWEDADFKMGVV